ncbi:MAG: hypothetical protein ABJA74_05990, partial [Lapillicoccus sp.]
PQCCAAASRRCATSAARTTAFTTPNAKGWSADPRCSSAVRPSQTGGHGDPRSRGRIADEDHPTRPGLSRVADGVTAVRAAARDELRKGADHVKIMASGGVASPTDRIDSTQYSVAEIEAVVEEAEPRTGT